MAKNTGFIDQLLNTDQKKKKKEQTGKSNQSGFLSSGKNNKTNQGSGFLSGQKQKNSNGFFSQAAGTQQSDPLQRLLNTANGSTQQAGTVPVQPAYTAPQVNAAPKFNAAGNVIRTTGGGANDYANRVLGIQNVAQPQQPVQTVQPVAQRASAKPWYAGGNIDLNNRQVVDNGDGTFSTERSIGINVDGKEYVIPTVINGKVVSDEEAEDHFYQTGEYLGVFDTPEEADRYAQQLHNRQQAYYSGMNLDAASAPAQMAGGAQGYANRLASVMGANRTGRQMTPEEAQWILRGKDHRKGNGPEIIGKATEGNGDIKKAHLALDVPGNESTSGMQKEMSQAVPMQFPAIYTPAPKATEEVQQARRAGIKGQILGDNTRGEWFENTQKQYNQEMEQLRSQKEFQKAKDAWKKSEPDLKDNYDYSAWYTEGAEKGYFGTNTGNTIVMSDDDLSMNILMTRAAIAKREEETANAPENPAIQIYGNDNPLDTDLSPISQEDLDSMDRWNKLYGEDGLKQLNRQLEEYQDEQDFRNRLKELKNSGVSDSFSRDAMGPDGEYLLPEDARNYWDTYEAKDFVMEDADAIYLYANVGAPRGYIEDYSTKLGLAFLMPEKARKEFNTAYNSGDKDLAMEVYERWTPFLKEMRSTNMEEKYAEQARGPYGAMAGLLTVITNPLVGMMGTLDAALSLAGRESDLGAPYAQQGIFNQAVRQEHAKIVGDAFADQFGENYRKWGEFTANVFYSVLDNAYAMKFGTMGTSGMGVEEARKYSTACIQFIMSSEAASSILIQEAEKGTDPHEAGIRALGGGAIEAITEKYSIERFLNIRQAFGGNYLDFLAFMGKSMFAEGMEEVASDLLNTPLDEVCSYIWEHSSELDDMYMQYYNEAFSEVGDEDEARRIAADKLKKAYADKLLMSGLAGAVSVIPLGASNTVRGYRSSRSTGNSIINSNYSMENINAMMQASEYMELDEDGKKLKKRIEANMKKNKVKPGQIGAFAHIMAQNSSAQVQQFYTDTYTDVVTEEMKARHMTDEAIKEQAPIVAKAAMHGLNSLTQREINILHRSATATELAMELFKEADQENRQLQDENQKKEEHQLIKDAKAIAAAKSAGAYQAYETARLAVKGESVNAVQAENVQRALERQATERAKVETEHNTANEDAIEAAVQAGAKRTNTNVEVVDGDRIGNIVGFTTTSEEVKDKSGQVIRNQETDEAVKRQIQKATIEVDGKTEEVDLADLKAANPQVAKLIANQRMRPDYYGDRFMTTAVQAAAKLGENINNLFADEAAKIKLSAVLHQAMPSVTMDQATAQELYHTAVIEQQEADRDAGANSKKYLENRKQGETRVNLLGHDYNTDEYNNMLTEENTDLTPAQKNVIHFAEIISSQEGINVEIFSDPNKYEGATLDRDGTLRVNLASNKNIIATISHEYCAHWLRTVSPEAFNEVAKFVFDEYKRQGKDVTALLDQRYDSYIKSGVYLTMDGAMEELVARSMEQVLTSDRYAQQLKENVSKSTFAKIKEYVHNIISKINKMLGIMRGSASNESWNLAQVRDQLADVWLNAKEKALMDNRTSPAVQEAEQAYEGVSQEEIIRQMQRSYEAAQQSNSFSLAGTKAQGVFGEDVRRAYELARQGVDNDTIMEETGCIPGFRGMWWKVLENENIKIRDSFRISDTIDPKRNANMKLADVLDAKELFEAYPQLKNTPIRFMQLDGNTLGESDGTEIRINGRFFNEESADNLKEVLDTVIKHEAQHVIQAIEGSYRGSSTEEMATTKERAAGNIAAAKQLIGMTAKRHNIDMADLEWIDYNEDGTVDRNTVSDEIYEEIQKMRPWEYNALRQNVESWNKWAQLLNFSDRANYERVIGEIEANAASERKGAMQYMPIDYSNAIAAEDYTGEQVAAAQRILKQASENQVARFSVNENNKGIQVQERTDGMVGVHNLSMQSLRKVLEMQGFPMPSIAVVSDKRAWTGYGDISIFFGKDAVRFGEGTVYKGDAFTPTMRDYQAKSKEDALEFLRQQPARDIGGRGSITQLIRDFMKVNNMDTARQLLHSDPGEMVKARQQSEALEKEVTALLDQAVKEAGKRGGAGQYKGPFAKGVLLAAEEINGQENLSKQQKLDILEKNISSVIAENDLAPINLNTTEEELDYFEKPATVEADLMSKTLDLLEQTIPQMNGGMFLEAKPNGILGLQDIQAIVMPQTDKALIQEMVDAGIAKDKIHLLPENYTPSDREAALKAIPKVVPEARFSLQEKDTRNSLSDAAKNVGMRETKSGDIVDSEGAAVAKELPGGSITKYSLRTVDDTITKELIETLSKKEGVTEQQVEKWVKDVYGIAAMIAEDRSRLDFNAVAGTMLRDNQEYVKSVDTSLLCAKRLLYQGIYNQVQHMIPNTPIMPDDLIDMINIMKRRGLVTPCGICYVESRRRMLGKYAKQWLDNYKGQYKPTLDQVTTTDGLEMLRHKHPEVYQDFVDAMNAKGSANPKVVQLRTEYKGEIKNLTENQIKKIKEIGGLRIQSFSDFEVVHMLDMMQVVMDMASRDLTSQAYTKVPEFAWVFGGTGIKINLSLIGEGTGLDENGNLIFSETEGMKIKDAMDLRNEYSKNVGTILVGMNDDHIITAMGDKRIDFIIPFHKSGWSKNEMGRVTGMSAYKDYTRFQNEKKIDKLLSTKTKIKTIPNKKSKLINFQPVGPNGYWDFNLTGPQNAEKYLELCKKDGRVPKFANFLVYDGDGGWTLPTDNSQRSKNIRKGYWKLLIDFKMYDNAGKASPQEAVRPEFNMKMAEKINKNYKGDVSELPSDPDTVKEITDMMVKKHNIKDVRPYGTAANAYGNMTLGNEVEEENGEEEFMPAKKAMHMEPEASYSLKEKTDAEMVSKLSGETNDIDVRETVQKALDNPAARFALKEPVEATKKGLIAVHNLTFDNLMDTLNEGAFTAPSVAVIHAAMGHNKYGPISVVFKSDAIDPRKNPNNKIFGADAYTPTRYNVHVETELKYKELINASKEIAEYVKGINNNVMFNEVERWFTERAYREVTTKDLQGMAEDGYGNSALMAAYLKSQGKEVPIKTRETYKGGMIKEDRIDGYQKIFEAILDSGKLSEFMQDVEHSIGKELIEKYGEIAAAQDERVKKMLDLYKEKGGGPAATSILNWLKGTLDYINGGSEKVTEYDPWATNNAITDMIDRNEFVNWLKKYLEPAFGEKGIRNNKDPYTPMGNSRSFAQLHDPYTIENVVKAMYKNAQQKAEGGRYAQGVIAAASKEYKSLQEVRNDSDRIRMLEEEEYEEVIQNLNKRLTELANEIVPAGSYAAHNFDYALIEAGKLYAKSQTKEAIRRGLAKENVRATDEQLQKIKEFLDDAREIPTGYFEAKPQRVVGFDEIATVLIPEAYAGKSYNKVMLKALEDAGINYVEYDGTNRNRLEILNRLEDAKFSIKTPDMDVNQWMEMLQPWQLRTEAERKLLADYKGLRTKIGLQNMRISETRNKIAELEAKEEKTKEDQRMIDALKKKLEEAQKERGKLEQRLIDVTNDEGYAKIMMEQSRFINDYLEGRTQNEVDNAARELEKSARKLIEEADKTREELKTAAENAGVKRIRAMMDQNSLSKSAADLRKTYKSTADKQEIMNDIAKIRLEIEQGDSEAAEQDVSALAGKILESTTGTSEYLSMLRGMTITLAPSQLKELLGTNRSIKDLRNELAGTGIKVKTASLEDIKSGAKTALSNSWDELCEMIPTLDRTTPAEQQVFDLVKFIQGEMRNSRSSEYSGRLGETMADIWTKVLDVNINQAADPAVQKELNQLRQIVEGLQKKAEINIDTVSQMQDLMRDVIKTSQETRLWSDAMRRDVGNTIEYFDKTARMAEKIAKSEKVKETIARMKSDAAKKLLKVNEQWRQQLERDRNARIQEEDNAATRRRIDTVMNRMGKLLSQPKGTDSIPEHVQGLARGLMEILVNNDLDGRRNITTTERGQLKELKRRLDAWKARDGEFNSDDLYDVLDENVADAVNNELDTIRAELQTWNGRFKGKNHLDTVTQKGEVLTKIQKAVSQIYSVIRAEQYVNIGEKKEALANAAYKVRQYVPSRENYKKEMTTRFGKKLEAMRKFIVTDNMTPEYFFRMLDNEGLSDIWEGHHYAENRNGLEQAKAKERLAEIAAKHGYEKWDVDKKLHVQFFNGTKDMTVGQLMSLYATWKREQQLGPEISQHLEVGGFYSEEPEGDGLLGKKVLSRKALRLYVIRDDNGRFVACPDMDLVSSLLSDDQKAFVDDVVEYMSTDMSKLGNEASMNAYGIKMYKEGYYFPFKMWDGIKNKKANESGKAANMDAVFHPSFSKTRMHGANNALILGDFMQTAADHIIGMINYATFGPANETLNKVLNFRVEEGYRETKTFRNIETVLRDAYGNTAMQYLQELKQQLNGGAVKIQKDFYDRLVSMFRKNAVAGSLSVAMQQPLSYIRAATVINPKYLAAALGRRYWNGAYKELMEHSGVAVIKDMGRFDMNFGQSARQYITPDGRQSAVRKGWDFVTDKLTILPEKMDKWTWTRMWIATKLEQQHLHPEMDPKSDEFLNTAAKRFNEIMRLTQVYDSVMVKSANMRSQGKVMRNITSFMAEPTLTINLLADAVRQAKAGKPGGKMYLAKAGATYLISAVLQAAIKGLAGAGRAPDDEKTAWENFFYRFGNNLISETDPLTLIPGYSDLITLLKNGEISDDAYGALGKGLKAATNTVDMLLGNGSDKGTYRDIEDSVAQIAQLFTNLPAKNLMRDVRMMYNWFVEQPFAEREGSAAVYKYQLLEQVHTADNFIGVINQYLGDAGYGTSNSDYYDRIYAAEKAGDTELAAELREYMLKKNSKLTDEKLTAEMNKRIKKDEELEPEEQVEQLMSNGARPTEYIKTMYQQGRITKDQATEMYKRSHPDATDKEVEKAIGKVEYELEHGEVESYSNYTRLDDAIQANDREQMASEKQRLMDLGYEETEIDKRVTDQIKQQYIDGTASRDETQKQLKEQMPDASKDDMWWEMDRLDFRKETGKTAGSNERYYRLYEAMDNNSASEIRKAIRDMTKHGVEKKNMKSAINNHYKPLYQQADRAGKRKILDAMQKAYKLIGSTAEDARETVNKWK